MPTSTVEDYLKRIYQEQGRHPDRPAATGVIASGLGLAPGTVTAMLKTLADSGLVDYEPYGGVRLTKAGMQLASHVLRRHRLIELFLVEIMGMSWKEVHPEAERLEHAVSDRLIDRIDEMLGRPSADPHGDPIPSALGEIPKTDHRTLLACPLNTSLRIARVTDQAPGFLEFLEQNRLTPGSRLQVLVRDESIDSVKVRPAKRRPVNLGFRAAARVLVETR
jgi:DtxR family Mn-dependent transcriptional regulator